MLPSRVNLSYIYIFLGPKDREHLKAAFFSTRNQPKVNRTQGNQGLRQGETKKVERARPAQLQESVEDASIRLI